MGFLSVLCNWGLIFCITKTNDDTMAFVTMSDKLINYNDNWIVDSGLSNHMTRDKNNLSTLSEYKGWQVDVTIDNSRLHITHVS